MGPGFGDRLARDLASALILALIAAACIGAAMAYAIPWLISHIRFAWV